MLFVGKKWDKSHICILYIDFPGDSCGNKFTCQCRRCKWLGFDPWVSKIPWNRKCQPTPVFLPRKFHGQRNPWSTVPGATESQTWLSDWAHSTLSTYLSIYLWLFHFCRAFVNITIYIYPGLCACKYECTCLFS